jgi:hypothetical protein
MCLYREEEMLTALESKYEGSIPSHLARHLEELHNNLDAQTDSSFVKQAPRSAAVQSAGTIVGSASRSSGLRKGGRGSAQ